ncbi:MAG: alpha/beta hydrolase [Polyangiaceae bacterium]|nr:alpha/beta hydrolase [Polyangiaceae bacterium]
MLSFSLRHGSSSLHLADFGGRGPTILLCHGLGGSHANFVALGPMLAERARVLALDLPGFGLSPPAKNCDLDAHVAAVGRVADAIRSGEIEGASAPLILIGNSMGGAVSILTASRRAHDVAKVVLVCPALPQRSVFDLDRRFGLLLGVAMMPGYDTVFRRRMLSAGPEAMVHELLNICCVDKNRVPPSAIVAMVELAKKRTMFSWLASSFSQSARSIVMTLFRKDAFRAAMRAVRAPVLLVHGARDRLVPVAAAHAAREVCPSWMLEIYDDIGHVPQLEAPDRLAASIFRFLESGEQVTAAAHP